MKHFITIFIFFSINTFNINAQDTLLHKVPFLGSERYILFDDGNFIFKSYLCGSSFVSYGNYKRTLFGIKFEYDTTKCPTPYVLSEKTDVNSDSITLFFYDMIKRSKLFYFGTITINNKNIKCFSDSITISKSDFVTDSVQFTYLNQNTIFCFDTSSSILKIYLEPLGYNCGVNEIFRLKKRKKGYLYTFTVFDKIEGKPWRKGKRRRIKHYYISNLR